MAKSDTISDTDDSSRPATTSYGLGFDFFHPETTKRERRRYWAHFGIYVLLMCLVVWPLFIPFNRIEPFVLGMPFNMFWSALIIGFVAINTYFLFRFEEGPLTATDDTGGL